jgi:DNA-binding GntR family transcriptional regulator
MEASQNTAKGRRVSESAYEALRRLLLRGEFAPGEHLTGQRLSEMLGVSRTPVRHALVRLQAEGLIETEGGQPARVRLITASEVEQAFDAGGGLEGVLVYRLAENAAPEQLKEMSKVVSDMERSADLGDSGAWVEADEGFHGLLRKYGDNPLVSQMLGRVESVVGQLRYFVLHTGPESMKLSAYEHRSVFDAISEGDGERARQLHQAHWVRVREVNARFLREQLSRMRRYLP